MYWLVDWKDKSVFGISVLNFNQNMKDIAVKHGHSIIEQDVQPVFFKDQFLNLPNSNNIKHITCDIGDYFYQFVYRDKNWDEFYGKSYGDIVAQLYSVE